MFAICVCFIVFCGCGPWCNSVYWVCGVCVYLRRVCLCGLYVVRVVIVCLCMRVWSVCVCVVCESCVCVCVVFVCYLCVCFLCV